MQKMIRFVKQIELYLSLTFMSVLVICVIWGVFTRYITEKPAVWTTELSGVVFAWVVLIGSMTAFRQNQHIRVTMLVDMFSPKVEYWINKFANICLLVFLVYATYLSVIMMMKGATRLTPVLRIPFSFVYLSCVIGFGVMALDLALQMIGVLKPVEERAEDIGDVL